jgi:hypothetical protein
VQHLLKLKLAADRDHRCQQGVHAVACFEGSLQANLELAQQIVKAQVR